ncbi:Lrp/AsnC family transcriptional regulator [Rhodovastum atsumiense]|uniref:Lrp/AsnC family transcriptional regulator n=2 Tax=Rhodovastum atsumiense TaxID=504468 RepID=A0A5M6ILZ6_9PROT|nr:Lrp/AsnC family transcriptional regulator [Rhodovastum atsumiense]KAA5609232.1 Lrp/AsnC family transcriptional regulator [Rhodovastum atsumiense]
MLDDRDRALLSRLQRDADVAVAELAEQVNLSPSACARRIARLRAEGYLTRLVARLDRRRMGLPTTVFVVVKTAQHSAEWLEQFRAALADVPEIIEAHRLTGNFDYILKIVLPNVEHYDAIYKKLIQRLPLFEVSAYISMETMKHDTPLPVTYG